MKRTGRALERRLALKVQPVPVLLKKNGCDRDRAQKIHAGGTPGCLQVGGRLGPGEAGALDGAFFRKLD